MTKKIAKTKKASKMTVYLVTKSCPDYDCGSACTEILNDKGYKSRKLAYDKLVADMLKEMNLKSVNEVPDPDRKDYDAMDKLHEYGIEDWGIPTYESDSKHKTCDGFIQTCDGEITYDIQEIVVEG